MLVLAWWHYVEVVDIDANMGLHLRPVAIEVDITYVLCERRRHAWIESRLHSLNWRKVELHRLSIRSLPLLIELLA